MAEPQPSRFRVEFLMCLGSQLDVLLELFVTWFETQQDPAWT